MAAQGLRDMDDGPEKIIDGEELALVKRQGRKVVASVVMTALAATSLLFV